VDLGAARVWCHTTHLHWRLGDGLAREKQVVAADRAARERGGDVHVHILGGDFNAAPDCDEIRFLAGRTTLAGVRTYWQGASARARRACPGRAAIPTSASSRGSSPSGGSTTSSSRPNGGTGAAGCATAASSSPGRPPTACGRRIISAWSPTWTPDPSLTTPPPDRITR